MDAPQGFCGHVRHFLFFLPIFIFLLLVGITKGAILCCFVLVIITFGDAGVVLGLWPVHLVYTTYSIIRSKKFGPYMKGLLVLILPMPITLWTVAGVLGSAFMGIAYGFVWPLMETFKEISKEGVPFRTRLIRCLTVGTWSNLSGACTIVRDFSDFFYHSYFSFMEELREPREEGPIEIKVTQIPGCILAAIVGLFVDVFGIGLIVMYKMPILLFKGWYRLIQDLIGRQGPFLESVCVPYAGLYILLWPIAVFLAASAGLASTFGFGCYAAAVAYQESSTKRGLLYAIAAISIFDEYTNDLLYLPEGSCYPRPKYRAKESTDSLLPSKGLHDHLELGRPDESLLGGSYESMTKVKAAVIWDNFFEACEEMGKELLRIGAIEISDLDGWRYSRNKILNIGIPSYVFLRCFLVSIKSGCPGFLLRDNVVITSINRPEGRIFEWLYEPMCLIKEQIRHMDLEETEELYFYKYCLYSGDAARIGSWQNGGIRPQDEIRRAQLEGIARRLQGFCLTLSRMPTSRRRFIGVEKAIQQEAKNLNLSGNVTFQGVRSDIESGR